MNIVVMGECMVELSSTDTNVFYQGFAGDVYNTAVYLKRLMAQECKVSILTAVGFGELSKDMLNAFKQECINTELVAKIEDKQPGLYMIKTAADGERSFSYWRENSAAKQMLSCLSESQKIQIEHHTDIFYFSGISLAILDEKDRGCFWRLIQSLKQQNTKIVFDTNYRSVLWRSKYEAKDLYHQAFSVSDIVFPGGEDFHLLYGIESFDVIADYLSAYSIPEIIIKNGVQGIMCISPQRQEFVEAKAVDQIVDTTSAGDAFNAGYLSARLAGKGMSEAAAYGALLAAFVIQHRGAIVNFTDFTDFIHSH